MARKKKVQEMTVSGFQSYLQGIVDFSGNGWHPTEEQWSQIYDLIQNLKTEVITVSGSDNVQPHQQGHRQQQNNAEMITSTTPSNLDGGAVNGTGDEPFTPVSSMRKQDMRNPTMIPKPGASKVAGGGQVASSGVTVVTPNKEADDVTSDFN